MDTLLLIVVCGGGFLVAYHTYGRFLARKIFNLDPKADVPSRRLNDGVDYVPSKKGIIFGHHFTSIAGTGPIVGPAIGIIWGWLPALLWVMLGSIFMGAVHDFGSLVVSMRNDGKSISEIAARYINPRVRFIFFIVVFFALLIVIAIFGMIIAIVFDVFPSSVLPVWLQIPIAVGLGYAVYKKGASVFLSTTVAVAGMYLCIFVGAILESKYPGLCSISQVGCVPATGVWTILLLVYAWIASTLPVTTLLQPRDYINAWQLLIMMALLVAGAIVTSLNGSLELVAPAIRERANTDIPSIWPMMFVTIACGAISGFHSLVASGTSPKQIANEEDMQFIGYGSMLLEGFLAVLVIVCVGAGIGIAYKVKGADITLTGVEAWQHHYASWAGASGLGTKLDAVVVGAANMLGGLGIPIVTGMTLMGVFIASFAGTTLDTTVRIQRYVIGEIANDLKMPFMANRWTATTFAVITAAALAFATGAGGKGALKLWPLFGAVNQLLASLALLVITMYLRRKGGLKFIFTAIPCVIMLVITCCAMTVNEQKFIMKAKSEIPATSIEGWLLAIIGGGIFLLAIWMVVETAIVFFRRTGNELRAA
ncbi:MAG: carbon starvation protein A [Phycisphaerae bacterium]|nr:carbon starvation protein A [Phycisphaerae bacterium]